MPEIFEVIQLAQERNLRFQELCFYISAEYAGSDGILVNNCGHVIKVLISIFSAQRQLQVAAWKCNCGACRGKTHCSKLRYGSRRTHTSNRRKRCWVVARCIAEWIECRRRVCI